MKQIWEKKKTKTISDNSSPIAVIWDVNILFCVTRKIKNLKNVC